MVRWLSDDEQQAWRKLARLLSLLPASLEAQLSRDDGLTHFGYWALAMLSEAPGHSLRMSELAASANASPSRLSHLITGLEKRGWVRRERAADDGRGNVAVLTESGYEKIVASAPGHVDQVRAVVFDALSPEQVVQLDEICGAILDKIAEKPVRPVRPLSEA